MCRRAVSAVGCRSPLDGFTDSEWKVLDFVVDEAVDVAEVFLYRPNLSAEGMTLRSFFEMIFRKKFPIIKTVPPEQHPEHLRMLHVRK